MPTTARALAGRLPLYLAVALPAQSEPEPLAETPITIGTSRVIRSDILDEDRKITVYLPESYADGEQQFGVIYLLDGVDYFHHTTGIVKSLTMSRRIPEMLVIGVGNTDRGRDMTPTRVKEGPNTGGSRKFIRFLTEELAPWVETSYRTKPSRILVGHSLGGLVVLDALVAKPNFYRGLIAASPSMWWDEQCMVGKLDAWLRSKPEADASLYITIGNEDAEMLGGTLKLVGLLAEMSPRGLRHEFQRHPRESHVSVLHRSTYEGLEFLFDGWVLEPEDAVAVYDYGGWPAIEAYFARVRGRLGYDRSVPPSGVPSVCSGLINAGRLDDALKFAKSRHRDDIPVGTWEYLASSFEQDDNLEGQKACLLAALEVNPFSKKIRTQLEGLGATLSTMPVRPRVAVPEHVLAAYVGAYTGRLSEKPIEVTTEGDGLRIDLRKPVDVIAISATQFVDADPESMMKFEFRTNASGEVTALVVIRGTRKFVCARTRPTKPTGDAAKRR